MNANSSPDAQPAEAILDAHLRLDEAIDESLQAVAGDTESSAIAIIKQVRALHDAAHKMAAYLDGSSLKAGDLGREIVSSVGYLVDIGAFINGLPGKMDRDFHSVQAVVKEIKDLSSMAEDVRAISMQSHLLAINAAIEASHAGSAGLAFRVVSEEMRKLAFNSGAVAAKVIQGLGRAREAVESGVALSIAESATQLADVTQAAASIAKLQDNLDDMSQYYKTRFAVVTKHNEDLSRDIAEVLGQIQYQDVVRQCIERIRIAMGRRNALLEGLSESAPGESAKISGVPQQLELILHDFLSEEDKHRHSVRQADTGSGDLKIELF